MAAANPSEDAKWVSRQVRQYAEAFPRYTTFAGVLQKVLQEAAKKHAPLAIVQTRPKAVASFAGKTSARERSTQTPSRT